MKKKYKNNKLYYKYECLNCGYIGDIEQNRLIKRKQRCSCCCKNSKIINEKNCINATHPWIKEFLKNENDGKKYLHGSDKKIIFRCPICKEEKLLPINKVIKNGFNCSNCGNGVSYPNKLMKEILKELKVDFIAEKKFIWSNNKRYDFFIPSKKIIIEMDGEQHYKFKEIKENDNLKDEMAYKNGILNVIRINCYKSDYKYIENELIKNNFFSFFNNEVVDVKKCDLRVKENSKIYMNILELWEKNYTTSEISKLLNLKIFTVRNYIKKLEKLNKVEYNGKYEINRRKRKQVIDNYTKKSFESISECARLLKISRHTIIRNKKRFLIEK